MTKYIESVQTQVVYTDGTTETVMRISPYMDEGPYQTRYMEHGTVVFNTALGRLCEVRTSYTVLDEEGLRENNSSTS